MPRKPGTRKSKVPDEATNGGQHCGAKTRRGTTCTQRAGWGTDHPGLGRCKLHGGATPYKTGRWATIPRGTLAEKLEAWREVERAELRDLTDNLRTANALLQVQIEELASAPDSETALTYQKAAGEWVDRIARLVDTVERIERGNRFVVTTDDAERLLERVADLIQEFLPDERADEFIRRLQNTA